MNRFIYYYSVFDIRVNQTQGEPHQPPLHCLASVSYTHLDVYKRQKLYSVDKLDNRLTILAIELAKLLYRKASITILSLSLIHISSATPCVSTGMLSSGISPKVADEMSPIR